MAKDKKDMKIPDNAVKFLAPQVDKRNLCNVSSADKIGRNKIALKPGRSLMDWIKVQQSSTPFQIRPISVEELRKHNKFDDAWICLQGKVYNVTPYMEYHPGGADELLKGAGKDATELFNQIHRWVNAESMLQKCFVGPLKLPSLWLQLEVDDEEDRNLGPPLPELDWAENDHSVSIFIRSSKNDETALLSITTSILKRKMFISVKNIDSIYKYKIELPGNVSSDYKVEKKNCIIEILLQKSLHKRWKNLQFPLIESITSMGPQRQGISYRPCKLVSKSSVNYNTSLLSFELPSESQMLIPIGHHVQIKMFVSGNEIIRSYTPVSESLSSDDKASTGVSYIHLMVKLYSDGIITPILDKCAIGETVSISDCVGDFSEEKLKTASTVILFAAGTGITPMIRIIAFCLKLRESKFRKCLLVFFNKEKKDILWNDQLKSLSEKDSRFSVFHVLSVPDSGWDGISGNISKQLIDDVIPSDLKNTDIIFCICGPIPFSKLAARYLNELGYTEENMHMFLG